MNLNCINSRIYSGCHRNINAIESDSPNSLANNESYFLCVTDPMAIEMKLDTLLISLCSSCDLHHWRVDWTSFDQNLKNCEKDKNLMISVTTVFVEQIIHLWKNIILWKLVRYQIPGRYILQLHGMDDAVTIYCRYEYRYRNQYKIHTKYLLFSSVAFVNKLVSSNRFHGIAL